MERSHPAPLVRPARNRDITRLEIFLKPFIENGRLLPRTAEELDELLSHGYVAEIDGEIVGFAALEVYSAKLAEIRSLAVAEEYQGAGLGRLLVQACIDRAHAEDILEVMAVTSSERFFKSCGFDFTLPGEKKALFIQTRDAT